MWYVSLFILGLIGGIVIMSVFAAATIDRLRWENKYLNTKLESKKSQVKQRVPEYQFLDRYDHPQVESEQERSYIAA